MGYVSAATQMANLIVDPSAMLSLILSIILAVGIFVSLRTRAPNLVTGFLVSNTVFLVLRTLLDEGLRGAYWNPHWFSFAIALLISILLFIILALAKRAITFGLFF